jgi:hypothetical protein
MKFGRERALNPVIYLLKLDGQGCSASISFKTYYDTEEVRACCAYFTPTSEAKLPFTV